MRHFKIVLLLIIIITINALYLFHLGQHNNPEDMHQRYFLIAIFSTLLFIFIFNFFILFIFFNVPSRCFFYIKSIPSKRIRNTILKKRQQALNILDSTIPDEIKTALRIEKYDDIPDFPQEKIHEFRKEVRTDTLIIALLHTKKSFRKFYYHDLSKRAVSIIEEELDSNHWVHLSAEEIFEYRLEFLNEVLKKLKLSDVSGDQSLQN